MKADHSSVEMHDCAKLAGDDEVMRNCVETSRRSAESCRAMAWAGH